MIDERINKSLTELEQSLRNVDSARKQVDDIIKSYGNLSETVDRYVSQLKTISTIVKELVDSVGNDYEQKVIDFEKDREAVIRASNDATEKLSNTTDEFKDSLTKIQKMLKYSFALNVVSIITIGVIIFLLVK